MKNARNRYPTFRDYVSKGNNETETKEFFRSLSSLPIEYIDKHILDDYIFDCRPDILKLRSDEIILDKIEAELATPNF